MSVPVPPSARTLTRAAALIREQNSPGRGYMDDTFLAVADWLDACALVVSVAPDAKRWHAERIARAYLGESAA